MEQLQIGTRDLPPTTHLRSLSHGTQLEALTVFQEHTAGMHLSHAKSAKSHPREGSSVGVMTYQQHPVRLAARLRILDHTDRHHRHHLHHRHAKERCLDQIKCGQLPVEVLVQDKDAGENDTHFIKMAEMIKNAREETRSYPETHSQSV